MNSTASWHTEVLGNLGREVRGSLTPLPDCCYELYSVPAFSLGHPEIVEGRGIGSSKRPVLPGDLLICKINPRINRVWIVSEPIGKFKQLASTEYLVFRLNNLVLARYLLWYLRSPRFRNWISMSAEGVTGSHTRAKSSAILNQLVPIPAVDEQRRIVEVIEEQFSRLDVAESILRHAERRLQSMLGYSFVSSVDLANVDYVPLGKIAEVIGGVTKNSKREGDSHLIEVKYLRVANVQRGFLDLTRVAMIRVDKRKAKNLKLFPGDILFNEGGDRDKLGRGWIWEGQLNDCIHQNHVFRARLNCNAFEPKFVSFYGNSIGQSWFERMGKQTTNLASLSLTTLKSFPIPRIPIEVQRDVIAETERRMSIFGRLLESTRTTHRRSERLRYIILKETFSGRLGLRRLDTSVI